MSLLQMLQQAGGGNGLAQLASQLGLDEQTTQSLAERMAPAISGGMAQRAQAEGGMGALLGTLQGNNAAQFANNPAEAAAPAAQAQGQDFLAQIFGSQEAAPQIAQAAAADTGATPQQAESLLPALAAMLQGQMQQQAPDTEIEAAQASLATTGDGAGAGLGDLLGALGGSSGGGGIGGLVSGLMGGGSGSAQQGGLGSLLAMLDTDGQASSQGGLGDMLGKLMR